MAATTLTAAQIQNKITRLNYLLKTNPKDPQIAQLRSNLKAAGIDPKTGQALPATGGGLKTGGAGKIVSTPTVPAPETGGLFTNDPKLGNVKPITSVPTAMQAENKVATYEADMNLQLNNPNQYNPFGSREITQDENGNISINDTLSQGQQNILTGGEQLSAGGLNMANQNLQGSQLGQAFNPELANRTSSGDMLADRQRIEDEVFNRLTRDLDQSYGRDKASLEQQLYNRGIQYSNDPNSQYQQMMGDLNRRYDDQRASAKGQAVQMGGEEWARSFGINEQLIANQLSQQSGIRNQQIGEVGALGALGPGLQVPNFQAYQGAQFDMANPLEAKAVVGQLNNQQQQLQIQQQAANKIGSGGGGAPQQPASPFYNTPPPGVG